MGKFCHMTNRQSRKMWTFGHMITGHICDVQQVVELKVDVFCLTFGHICDDQPAVK
jgi:hypothetical protein